MMVSVRRKLIIRVAALLYIRKLIKRRRYWVHPMNRKRDEDGEHLKIEDMYINYPERFFEYTRLSPQLFDILYDYVGKSLEKNDTNYRKSIPAKHRLFVILRYLSTGDSIRTIATNFSMGQSTVWKILRLDLPNIWTILKGFYLKCPTIDEWTSISRDFYEIWNYPNCLGAVDGKHVQIQAPANSGSLYLNYKGTFSIVLMATCDATYKFSTVDIGGYGKQSDGGIFAASKLGTALRHGTLPIPSPTRLAGSEITLPYHFIGDEAFPLTIYMMRPFPGASLTDERRIFNYRLSRARRCIENALGIMAARWRIFQRVIMADPKFAEQIVLAAVALHNFIQTEELKIPTSQRWYCPLGFADSNGEDNGGWRRETTGMPDVSSLSIAAHERMSKTMRDDLINYFVNEGSVDWQNERAGV